MNYKLNPGDQQRFDQFAAADPTDLTNEVALARLYAERAAQKDQPSAVAALLQVIAKVSASHVAAQKAKGELLSKAVVLQIGTDLVNLLAAELQNVPNYELILTRVAEQMERTITVKSIEGP